jgi:hypothetical protein
MSGMADLRSPVGPSWSCGELVGTVAERTLIGIVVSKPAQLGNDGGATGTVDHAP